jgi:hypothetical protein
VYIVINSRTMKWTFIIREKLKVAFLLAGIMVLIGLTNVMERRNVKNLDQSFSSIYYDRLIPATDIFYLTSNLYKRRMLMEQFLFTEQTAPLKVLEKNLSSHSDSIMHLIAKFEKTLLVKEESVYLAEFKRRVLHYNDVESRILDVWSRQSPQHAQKLYNVEGKNDLLSTIQYLEELTRIQSSVGLDLIHTSKGIASSSDMLMSLQIAVAIVIGLLIHGLIAASNVTRRNNENFNLN